MKKVFHLIALIFFLVFFFDIATAVTINLDDFTLELPDTFAYLGEQEVGSDEIELPLSIYYSLATEEMVGICQIERSVIEAEVLNIDFKKALTTADRKFFYLVEEEGVIYALFSANRNYTLVAYFNSKGIDESSRERFASILNSDYSTWGTSSSLSNSRDLNQQAQECFKVYCTALKNPYSATLQEYQHYSSLKFENYEYYLLAVTALNGFGSEVAESGFAIYDTSTGGICVALFGEYIYDGSMLSHVNKMAMMVLDLNLGGGQTSVVRSNLKLSNKEIGACLDEFYDSWDKWE